MMETIKLLHVMERGWEFGKGQRGGVMMCAGESARCCCKERLCTVCDGNDETLKCYGTWIETRDKRGPVLC